ncbi:uncharacterized protein LOC132300911 [Cornus florida]|uniref:uncharacterized protein LOC132300911 n=1 Tax=Cornus florida TaxID=4283 RepID=UPI002898B579|nr:uncharacterized protein LOC132300911 [Cornus florida]
MRRELFLRILNSVTTYDEWFIQKPDALGRMGFTPIQKMTAAIRILAYGISTDLYDKYIKISERIAIESLKRFCDAIIVVYAEQYLRSPNVDDIACLLREREERSFPSMLGSIDCMHWEWKNCPTAWHGTHTRRSHKPTLILEAVALKNLWIWHAFFGMAGSYNDLNVLDHFPVFKSMINGSMPPINYVVNGHRRTMGYYLSNGIYPKWATLMQTIPHPTTVKEKLFANKQEAVRKDVERAFGVLQMRWAITHQLVLYWNTEDLNKIMRTCIILHNMIIEDEGEHILQWTPPTDDPISLPYYVRNPSMLAAHISSRLSRIRNRSDNADLRRDLMEHLWNQFDVFRPRGRIMPCELSTLIAGESSSPRFTEPGVDGVDGLVWTVDENYVGFQMVGIEKVGIEMVGTEMIGIEMVGIDKVVIGNEVGIGDVVRVGTE